VEYNVLQSIKRFHQYINPLDNVTAEIEEDSYNNYDRYYETAADVNKLVRDEKSHSYPPPSYIMENQYGRLTFAQVPQYGSHRPEADAIMTFSIGYNLEKIIYFITSLVETGYDGDIIIGTATDLGTDMRDFLEYYSTHHHVIVYEIPIDYCCRGSRCKVVHMYKTNSSLMVPDGRDYRTSAILRYEYYYEWSSIYQSKSRILVTDSRDVFFQRNPFEKLHLQMETHLLVFDSGATKNLKKPSNHSMLILESGPDYNWIRNAYNNKTLAEEIKFKPSSCSGTTIGGQPALSMYTRAMVDQFDYSMQIQPGHRGNYDQAFHNVLLHKNLLINATNITKVILYTSGGLDSPVRTMGQEIKHRLKERPLVDISWFKNRSGEELIVNFDGLATAIVHQGDRHPEIARMIKGRAAREMMKWNKTTAIKMIENL
jgi:hypothetical protein